MLEFLWYHSNLPPRATIIQQSQLWRAKRMEGEWLRAGETTFESLLISNAYAYAMQSGHWGIMLWTGQGGLPAPAASEPTPIHFLQWPHVYTIHCPLHHNLIVYLWFSIVLYDSRYLVIHLLKLKAQKFTTVVKHVVLGIELETKPIFQTDECRKSGSLLLTSAHQTLYTCQSLTRSAEFRN